MEEKTTWNSRLNPSAEEKTPRNSVPKHSAEEKTIQNKTWQPKISKIVLEKTTFEVQTNHFVKLFCLFCKTNFLQNVDAVIVIIECEFPKTSFFAFPQPYRFCLCFFKQIMYGYSTKNAASETITPSIAFKYLTASEPYRNT